VTSPFRLKRSNFIFQLNICGYSPCVTPSLMRGWVCRLQLLLVFTSAVILRAVSHRAHCHILLSQSDSRLSPTWRARSPYLYRPGTEWPSYTHRQWVRSPSSPTTRRATVEVFDPASSRPAYNPWAWTAYNTPLLIIVSMLRA
jgi:hypothetical protein